LSWIPPLGVFKFLFLSDYLLLLYLLYSSGLVSPSSTSKPELFYRPAIAKEMELRKEFSSVVALIGNKTSI
jgi:hypothetical protein